MASAANTSRTLSEGVALSWYLRHSLRRHEPPSAALLQSARFTRNPRLRTALRRELEPELARLADRPFPAPPPSGEPTHLPAALLAKPRRSGGEKGVVFLANEGQLDTLLASGRFDALAREHYLVVASAWSPPAYQKFARVVGRAPDPLFVGISNDDDMVGLAMLAPWIRPVPLLSADWLDPADFDPRPRDQRDIDILMVAGWGSYKRHWLLFHALRRMRRDLRVVLVGGDSSGRTVEHVKAEARAFHVRQDVEFHTALPVQEVYALQARARVALQLSVREGSCVAVTESLFADTPVGMMADAHVGTKRHINAETGTLFEHRGLARQVERFLDRHAAYSPRAWAERHISYHQSCATLNGILREHARRVGDPWTEDIRLFYRRYFTPWYADPADAGRLADAVAAVRESCGVALRAGGGERPR